MTRERPWLLLLTILPVVWRCYEWRKHKVIYGREISALLRSFAPMSFAPIWIDRGNEPHDF